jgi:copper homeostasis protein
MRARFELCAETVYAATVAERGGADRVELCVNLAVAGMTPPVAMVREAVEAISIPLHVLIRPRAGDFAYTPEEFALMRAQIEEVKALGVQGVVLGVLRSDGRVDVERTRELVEAARPMKVTFHRAFDEVADMTEGLEAVIATGADLLLTSGGRATVLEGAGTIAELVRQAKGRIEVMAAGGVRPENLEEALQRTGAPWLHGSLLRREAGGDVREEDVLEVMQLLCVDLPAGNV